MCRLLPLGPAKSDLRLKCPLLCPLVALVPLLELTGGGVFITLLLILLCGARLPIVLGIRLDASREAEGPFEILWAAIFALSSLWLTGMVVGMGAVIGRILWLTLSLRCPL